MDRRPGEFAAKVPKLSATPTQNPSERERESPSNKTSLMKEQKCFLQHPTRNPSKKNIGSRRQKNPSIYGLQMSTDFSAETDGIQVRREKLGAFR